VIWIFLALLVGIAVGAALVVCVASRATRSRLRRQSFLRAALDINTMVIDVRRRLVDLAKSRGRA
jgi:uncharacterized membrane-anchored protein YhcB (DUF1043 family)